MRNASPSISRASLGQPRGAAGGPPNPNGPKGCRYYTREARKRDAPPGSPQATLPEGAMREPELFQRMALESMQRMAGLANAGLAGLMDDPRPCTATEVNARREQAEARYRKRYVRSRWYSTYFLDDGKLSEMEPVAEPAISLRDVRLTFDTLESAALNTHAPKPPQRMKPCEPIERQVYYLQGHIDQPERVAADVARFVDVSSFDTIVGRGLSGALLVPFVARALSKRWCIVRKQDGCHSSNAWEGTCGVRWLFLDDLIASGSTLQATMSGLLTEFHRKHMEGPHFVGAFFYSYRQDPFYPANCSPDAGGDGYKIAAISRNYSARRVGNMG